MKYPDRPTESKLQPILLNQIRSGSALKLLKAKRKPFARPYFTLDGEKIHAKTPMALIRKGLICETRLKDGQKVYVETIK